MRRIPVVIVAAAGAGLIGVLVMVAGLIEIHRCFDGEIAFERCLGTFLRGWKTLLIVYVCAAIGGALNAQFFGRTIDKMWVKVGFALLGAVLSTLYGGALAGFSFGIIGASPFDNFVADAVIGGAYGFVFAFSTWVGASVWILGFMLLELTMRKRRQYDE